MNAFYLPDRRPLLSCNGAHLSQTNTLFHGDCRWTWGLLDPQNKQNKTQPVDKGGLLRCWYYRHRIFVRNHMESQPRSVGLPPRSIKLQRADLSPLFPALVLPECLRSPADETKIGPVITSPLVMNVDDPHPAEASSRSIRLSFHSSDGRTF